MNLVRTVSMPINHSYYGRPIEYGFVELYVNSHYKPTEQGMEKLKDNQGQRLLHMAKRMPHKFWQDHPELCATTIQEPILGYTLHKLEGK